MRPTSVLALALLVVTACGQTSVPSGAGTTSQARTVASASPSSGRSNNCTPAFGYGLLFTGASTLELISPSGCVAASAALAPAAGHVCASGMGDVLPPPVSASNHRVYFRDGATKVRYITPDGSTGDTTTVPGGPSTVSVFSVSPDDQRIAVVVEDASNPSTIALRLYVEDLNGGGHHTDIYTTSTPNGKPGTTLWPMGWHGASLVLSVNPVCTFEPLPAPSAWHVADSGTARRTANIDGSNCALSSWPSASGVVCVGPTTASIFDWSGAVTRTVAIQPGDSQSALSPNGLNVFFNTGFGYGAPPPATRIVAATGSVSVPGHAACLFIDDGHLLAPDAVISFPPVVVTTLPAFGSCAGRFPGGL